MNHSQRAIFLGRLSASRLYSEASAALPDRESISALTADKNVVFSRLASAALPDIKGKRVDEWLVEQISESSHIEPPADVVDVCSRCASLRTEKGQDPHICTGEDIKKDLRALNEAGLCIQVLFDAYRSADRVARYWYRDVSYLAERAIEFHPAAQKFRSKTDPSSNTPHDLGDEIVFFPANAITRPPLTEGRPFEVRLSVSVDKVEADYICQTVMILHHELFCHAFQFYQEPEDWPDINDEFVEGFMNTAALHALKSSAEKIESSVFPWFGCRNKDDLCGRLTPLYEARDATPDGKLSRIGREAFWDLNDLCTDIDPKNPSDVAASIAVRLNSDPLKPIEKFNFIIMLRRMYSKLGKLGDKARKELVELFARLLDELDELEAKEFLEELSVLDDAWRTQAP